MTRQYYAELVLAFITLLWGTSFIAIKFGLESMSPIVFVMLRFFLSALMLLPFVITQLRQTNREMIFSALLLAIVNLAHAFSFTMGLQTIHSGRSAFISGMYVVFVPFLLPLFKLGRPLRIDLLAAVLSVFGLLLLTHSYKDLTGFTSGDGWTLFCALCYAIYFLLLQKITLKINRITLLMFYFMLLTGVIALFALPFFPHHFALHWHGVWSLLFMSFVVTGLVLWLQAYCQRYTTAMRAGIIYLLSPVFAMLLGYVILDERLQWWGLCGGGLIVSAIILPELFRWYHRQLPI